MFLIFVMVLASCSSFARNTQSPSATPTVSVTQAPSSGTEAAWKTYTNAEVGFSIQYPANWQEQDLPDENAGQMHHIALQGPEGGMELSLGSWVRRRLSRRLSADGCSTRGLARVSYSKGGWNRPVEFVSSTYWRYQLFRVRLYERHNRREVEKLSFTCSRPSVSHLRYSLHWHPS